MIAQVALNPPLIKGHPNRLLFGPDEVAPTNQKDYLKVDDMYVPLFLQVTTCCERPQDVEKRSRDPIV